MKQAIADVEAFHTACDVPRLIYPGFPSDDRIALRITLVQEEIEEFLNGIAQRDIVAVADGIADAIYVLIGSALEFGIPLDRVWNEIQRSNLSKIDPETGRAIKRSDGKILKGKEFRPANIAAAMTGDLFRNGWLTDSANSQKHWSRRNKIQC